MMEYFSIDTLVAILGLFIGGGGGAFFTWRWQRRKAAAEAKKEELDYYKQVIEDITIDRDYYKQERDEVRERMDKMAHSFMDWRLEADKDRMDMKLEIARLGRRVEVMAPFMCVDLQCKLRKRVVLSEDGEPKKARQKKADIEPSNEDL